MTQPAATTQLINGLDVAALHAAADEVTRDPRAAQTRWSVRTRWLGALRTRSEVSGYEIGGQRVARNFTIDTDEPAEILGENTAPNPQELLLSALAGCLSVGFAVNAASMGIEIQRLELELAGNLDLRGPFGLDPAIVPGFTEIECTVHLRADAPPEQLKELHQKVQSLSPNFYHLTKPIPVRSKLIVEE